MSHEAGEEMIGQCRTQDAPDNGHGTLETGGKNQGQKLRFVTDFAQGDNEDGEEKSVHGWLHGSGGGDLARGSPPDP